MYYTIATISESQGQITVNFNKDGNQYTVYMHNNGRNESTKKRFDNINEAYAVFEKITRAIVLGNYNYEERKAMLA